DAKVPLSIIDIPETAQRNVTALYESNDRGAGLLYFDDTGGLLTVTSGSELYLARRFDFTMTQIRDANEAYREDLYGRILVELQRTLDNFERQNSQIVLSRIMLGPQPEPTELCTYLQSNFGMDVREVDLPEILDFRDTEPDLEAQWRFFHLIGCAIRSENEG
ncbi:MAG: agglutinin biogenesis protein MshI, partial [Betaproteobacteria bacterium]|nr:agglutinin biogenesis protein MshI [Betaproteobacteria bacterium]